MKLQPWISSLEVEGPLMVDWCFSPYSDKDLLDLLVTEQLSMKESCGQVLTPSDE